MRMFDLDECIEVIEAEWGYEGIREDIENKVEQVEAIPVKYLMEKAMESREVEKRHRCDYLGDLAGQTADVIEGIILKWREENESCSCD